MDDRVFLIAGASSGIGAATARQAAEAGYKVVLGARSEDKLQALAEETGGLAVRADVTHYPDQENLVERALDEPTAASTWRSPTRASAIRAASRPATRRTPSRWC